MQPSSASEAVVDLTDDIDEQMQQAIAASLFDMYYPTKNAVVPAELQAQQSQEFEYYHKRHLSSWQAPDSSPLLAPNIQRDTGPHLRINSQEGSGHDCVMKVQQADEAVTPLEQAEGSQASTTSAEPSLSAPEPSGQAADNAQVSSMETPKGAEARLPAVGLIKPGPLSQSRIATWPTAAAQLGDAYGLPAKSAVPSSPASGGSTRSFTNKRRKLNSSHAGFGHDTHHAAWQTSQPAFHSSHLPTEHAGAPASDTTTAGMTSDAESPPQPALASAPPRRNADSHLTHALPSSPPSPEQQISPPPPDLLASTEQLLPDPGDLIPSELEPEYCNQTLVKDDVSSDGSIPFRLIDYGAIDAKGKWCIGPSPLPQYDPEQESTLDHTKMGDWVWWRFDGMWRFAQVTARYCNFFGVVDEYSISVLDDAGDEFPVEDVPPGQIYMHFPPGSRVNVRWKRPVQGEVLPVPYRNMFQGLYTVRLDEGQEAQVPHCDMTLLYNDAEASSWVQDAATSQFPQDDNVAEPQAGFLQQQQQPQAGDGTHTCLTQGAPASLKAPKIKLPGVSLCNARPPAANPARHCGSMGNAHLSSEAATGAVHSQQEEAKERVVPQLRRTKRTVAQKRLASHDPSVPPSAGRSVQRKLSHGQHPGGSDSSRASVRETHAVPVAHTASPAAKLGSQVLTAEQKADDPQLSGWELDSDDDLFVDLSGANILRTVSSGLQGIHPSATHVTALEDGESVAM